MNRRNRSTPALHVPRAVIVVVPVMSTEMPVAVDRSVVAALAMLLPLVCRSSQAATAVVAPVPPLATATAVPCQVPAVIGVLNFTAPDAT